MSQPFKIGDTVKPYGKVVAVGTTGGERYYWLQSKSGCISMMPASAIEGQIMPPQIGTLDNWNFREGEK